jgi:hypothetical protein
MNSGIDPTHLRVKVIRPALDALSLGGDAAEELLLGTALQESGAGRFLIQNGGGPALGIWQIEPNTHDDIWDNFLKFRPDLAALVRSMTAPGLPLLSQLSGNLFYAATMARLIYFRAPFPLPAAGEIAAQAAFYKARYNSANGAATEAEYIAHWNAARVATL